MQLRMNSQAARIGMNISEPFLRMQIEEPQISMKTEPSQLRIESQKSTVTIDQSECFADEGHRNIRQFMDYWVGYSKREYSRGIARTVAVGNRLAAIHTGYSIADMARDAMYEEKEFNIVAIPDQPPEIEVIVERGSFDYKPAEVRLELRMGDIEYSPQLGDVQIYMARYNRLNIEWIDDRKVDITV